MLNNNPYRIRHLAFRPEFFIGRREILFKLIDMVYQRPVPLTCVIMGPNGIGKSALLTTFRDATWLKTHLEPLLNDRTANAWDREVQAVRTYSHETALAIIKDFQEVRFVSCQMNLYMGGPSFEEFFSFLYNALFQSLPDVPPLEGKAFDTLLQFIRAIPYRLVIILDDANQIISELTSPIDKALRRCAQYVGFFIVIDKPTEELIDPNVEFDEQFSFFLNISQYYLLGLLDEEEARQLIQAPFSTPQNDALPTGIANGWFSKPELSVAECNQLLDIAGRQPYFLLLVCEQYLIFRDQTASIALTQEEWPQRFMHFLLRQQGILTILRSIWAKIPQVAKEALLEVAQAEPKRQSSAISAYLLKIWEFHAVIAEDVLTSEITSFSRCFTEYISTQKTLAMPQPTPMTRPLSDTQTLFQTLGNVDKRVYHYLQTHPMRVSTFNELMYAGWSGKPTNRRNLDAAVHRLRMALEQAGYDGFDIIQNVRNTGFRFVPVNQQPSFGERAIR